MSASHHIIYKTTCTATGKWYIGVHSTDVLDDGYLGSGIRLTNSVRKHGRTAHVREVLEQLPTREAAIRREAELVTAETLVLPGCMNLRVGGQGHYVRTAEQLAGMAERLSDVFKRRWANPESRAQLLHSGWQHREDSKTKIAAARRGGKWINRDGVNRFVKSEELATHLADGYTLGRARKNA